MLADGVFKPVFGHGSLRYLKIHMLRYALHRLSINHVERSPERFVTAHQLGKTLPERFLIQGTADMEGYRDIVSGAGTVELVDKPETLLRER
jgi:hypothetical protein